jgi:CRISP-associated protein Cas1
MSYHVISLLQEGAMIRADRGFLVCQYKDGTENRIALADVRAIVCAHPAIAFTNQAIARLLAQDSVILHCDRHYKPVGWSVPLDRVIRGTVFQRQVAAPHRFTQDLWRLLILAKMQNQADTLTQLQVDHTLHRLISRPLPNEANVARAFWKPYLTAIGAEFGRRERQGAASFENKALNYGYAVVATLVHRALLVHGLLPNLGIHHKFRYRSAPLVYDVMEPCRGIVDRCLADWRLQPTIAARPWATMSEPEAEVLFKDWVAALMNGLRRYRLRPNGGRQTLKWLDAPDRLARSLARCFEEESVTPLWTPSLAETYWHDDNLVEEEEAEDEFIR